LWGGKQRVEEKKITWVCRQMPIRARCGSSDSSDEDMASYDGDIDCRSDEDEDDGRSPVYATRSSAHGVKQPTLSGNDIAVIYPILHPRLTSLSQLLH